MQKNKKAKAILVNGWLLNMTSNGVKQSITQMFNKYIYRYV